MPEIPPLRVAIGGGAVTSNSYVSVDEFEDARDSQVIVDVNGRQSSTATSVGLPVQDAISKALEQSGFVISDSAPIVISGKVLKWDARVTTGFPATVSSDAKVFIQVLDPASKPIYTGTYEGSASRQEPGIQEAEVRKNLGTAMSEAIAQLVADQKLVRLLSSF